ncbi:hypothetical protein G9I05_004381 [Salmonella enterica]|nr:hypothetical protein [Salmonella enterica]EIO8738855.1 hypothetical protein [Salmonella enterica]
MLMLSILKDNYLLIIIIVAIVYFLIYKLLFVRKEVKENRIIPPQNTSSLHAHINRDSSAATSDTDFASESDSDTSVEVPEKSGFRKWENADGTMPVDATIHIRYKDFAGDKTDRDVLVTHYHPDNGYFMGFCYLRKERRTFKVERVIEAVDLDTGELIHGLRRFFRQHRTDKKKK